MGHNNLSESVCVMYSSTGGIQDFPRAFRHPAFVCEWGGGTLPQYPWLRDDACPKIEEIADEYSRKTRFIFNGHSYLVIPLPLQWYEAKRVCEDMGGYLCCVESAPELEFLKPHIPSDNSVWLGATDVKSLGNWKWVNGSPWEFSQWCPGQPDNFDGGEHFLACYGKTHLWNDAGDLPYPFICEWDSIDPAKTTQADAK